MLFRRTFYCFCLILNNINALCVLVFIRVALYSKISTGVSALCHNININNAMVYVKNLDFSFYMENTSNVNGAKLNK